MLFYKCVIALQAGVQHVLQLQQYTRGEFFNMDRNFAREPP